MFIKNWKQEICTVPNLLTLLRLGLLPVYANIYLNAEEPRDYLTAGAILAFSCATDLADGFIARRFHQITQLGKVLDPLADKITQFTLTYCLSLKYPPLRPVLLLFIVKEAFQLSMGLRYLKQGRMLSGALMAGKVCTTVLFISLILMVLLPELPAAAVKFIAVTEEIFLTVSFGSYILAYLGETHLKPLESEE